MNKFFGSSSHVFQWSNWRLRALDIVDFIITDHVFLFSFQIHVMGVLMLQSFKVGFKLALSLEVLFFKKISRLKFIKVLLFVSLWVVNTIYGLLKMWECLEELRILCHFS